MVIKFKLKLKGDKNKFLVNLDLDRGRKKFIGSIGDFKDVEDVRREFKLSF